MTNLNKPVEDFLNVVHALFGPKGCPWTQELDLSQLQRTLEEEVHEVLAAYASEDWEGISDELGDLLFNILCIAKVLEKSGHGVWTDSFAKAADKYKRRSPHVFLPGRELKTAKEVELQWLTIKEQERKERGKSECDLERSLKELPTIPLFAKVLERMKHHPRNNQTLEAFLEAPSDTKEEQIAKEFMLLAQKAYKAKISLETVGKRLLKELLPQLDM